MTAWTRRRPGLQEVEDRLALLERLKRKYGPTLDDVIERGRDLAREQELLTGVGERAEDLQKALATASDRFLKDARELSRLRREAASRFARTLEGLLADLAMIRTRFEVRFNAAELGPEEWGESGIDRERVLRVAQPRGGSPTAGADCLRRGTVACDAGAEDDGRGE